MKKLLISLILALALTLGVALPAFAASTADVTVTATPSYVAIADNATAINFNNYGTITESATIDTPQGLVAITNTSSVQIDTTIAAVTDTWTSAGVAWTHSNTATPGADTVGLYSSNNTGVYDIVVQTLSGTPQSIYANLSVGISFSYELRLKVPTSFSDGLVKTNTVRITAAAG